MSDHLPRLSNDEDATSLTSSQAHQTGWMSRWINRSSKPGSIADSSPMICYKEGHVDARGGMIQSGLNRKEDGLRFGKGTSEGAEIIKTGTVNENLTSRLGNFENKFTSLSSPTVKLCQNKENASTSGTQVHHEFGHKSMALTLAGGREGTSSDFNLRSKEQQVMSPLYQEGKGVVGPRSRRTNESNSSKPFVIFNKKNSNDNFTCFSQERCKYQKSSSVLFHEKKMENDLFHDSGLSDALHVQHGCSAGKKNFQSLFLKKQPHHVPSQPLNRVQCSFRNVETMRICTMVDSVEKTPGDPPKISQRAHHILFTKETCVNMSKGHQLKGEPSLAHQKEKTFDGSFSRSPNNASHSKGVRIQPLWTSTDSEEKENTGNPSTCKPGSMHEESAETDGMQVEVHKNQHILLGMESPPLTKDDTVDENSPPTACDSSTEKARSKRSIAEIPDINEEPPGLQPAVSSTDGKHPITSRVHRLNAKQLFSCQEQTSRSESNACHEHSPDPDTSNRWIKRLKLSSFDTSGVGTKSRDTGEGSSHEKFNTIFGKIVKCHGESVDTKLCKDHGKEQMAIDHNLESLRNDRSSYIGSKMRDQSMMLGCSWIQRWCQSSTAPPPKNPAPLVICDPHSMKLEQDELAKKQFPSIGAMALMGKAMNGFRSCEFQKRGPVVVWNTKE